MGLARDDGVPAVSADQLPLLDNLLDQVALALERARLEGEAREFARVPRTRSGPLGAAFVDRRRPQAAADRDYARGARAAPERIGRQGARIRRRVRSLEDRSLPRHVCSISAPTTTAAVQVGEVTIDLFRRAVLRDGEEVHLTPKEISVLAELAKHPGRVLTHAHLLRTAWGPAQEGQTEYLRVAIRALRQKLERDPSQPELIINEPAVGYRLRAAGSISSGPRMAAD